MGQANMEIGEVRMSFTGVGQEAERAERVSRLVFEHVHEMMGAGLSERERSAEINYLDVGPIRVSFDSIDDKAIARETANEIYRVLLQALER